MKLDYTDPHHLRALRIAAGHFLCEVPENDLDLVRLIHTLDNLDDEDTLPDSYTPCEMVENHCPADVADLIVTLALDMLTFAEPARAALRHLSKVVTMSELAFHPANVVAQAVLNPSTPAQP